MMLMRTKGQQSVYTRFSRKSNFLQIGTNMKTICTTQTDLHVSTTNTSKSKHFLPACEVKITVIFQHVNTWLSGRVCAGGNRLLGRCGAHSFLSQADFDLLLQQKRFGNSGSITNADLTPIFPTQKNAAAWLRRIIRVHVDIKRGCKFLQSSLAGRDSRDGTL